MFRIKRILRPGTPSRCSAGPLQLVALGLLLGLGLSLGSLKASSGRSGQWILAGGTDYTLTRDGKTLHDVKPSHAITCTSVDAVGSGSILQQWTPREYLGKRVRMSAWVKTAGVEGGCGLWMRVEGPGLQTLAYDNMGRRPIRGTTDWTRFEIVLDVAKEAVALANGLSLEGPGRAWVSDPVFEEVGPGVPVTDTVGAPLPVPRKWFLQGGSPGAYGIARDGEVDRDGIPAYRLASLREDPKGFGTLMRIFEGRAFLGKRVRMSAWVKCEDVRAWAGLWMRVDGPDGNPTAFDNMHSRPLQGSRDWTLCQVTLDMNSDAQALALGVLLAGTGKVWMTEPQLEVVGKEVPVTGDRHLAERSERLGVAQVPSPASGKSSPLFPGLRSELHRSATL